MITHDLFDELLVKPVTELGGTELFLVSGYATANFVHHHLSHLRSCGYDNVIVNLIVGMVPAGLECSQHTNMLSVLRMEEIASACKCRYYLGQHPAHAKAYLWRDCRGTPIVAFCGSANYTQRGFGGEQVECMTKVPTRSVQTLYDLLLEQSVDCLDEVVKDEVNFVRSVTREHRTDVYDFKQAVTLSWLESNSGETHQKAGINWGQRSGRNPNQAYIPIPSEVRSKRFFPTLGQTFTVIADDEFSFLAVVAQEQGKAIHSTLDNSIIGKYFRKRLGVSDGTFVTKEHFKKYGRTDVTFTKIDEDSYFMDFTSSES